MQDDTTHIVFESPYRLAKTLRRMATDLRDADVCVVRELTKIHEEIVRGTAAEVADEFDTRTIKGECVILVRMNKPKVVVEPPDPDELRTTVEGLMEIEGTSRRDAVERTAENYCVPTQVVYRALKENE